MYGLILAAFTIAPLIGVALMELGAFGPDVRMFGYPNGATRAFAMHLVVFLAAYFLVAHRRGLRQAILLDRRYAASEIGNDRFRRLAQIGLLLNLCLLVYVFVGAGAWEVVIGRVGRGQFRSTLGSFGALAYLARDFLTPMSAALVAVAYRRIVPTSRERHLLVAVLVVAGLNGVVWGYKASLLFMITPALVVLFPRVRLRELILLGAAAVMSTAAFAMIFDRVSPNQALLAIGVRATVGAGNTAWRIWDLHQTGEQFPSYWPTLLSMFGGKVGASLGVFTRGNADILYRTDYASMMTMVAQNYAIGDPTSSNVTGTVFSEGILALGSPGFLILSVFGGLLAGVVRRALQSCLRKHQALGAALVATYFSTNLIAWLNSGGVATLFQVPFVINYTIAWLMGAVMLELSGIPLTARAREPAPIVTPEMSS
jgi:hypothetical protein